MDISLRENSRPDEKRMSEVMCKSCAESILQNNKYDVAFIDYRTREVIPIDETMHVYCRGDYVIYGVSSSEDSIKYLVFYAPEHKHIKQEDITNRDPRGDAKQQTRLVGLVE